MARPARCRTIEQMPVYRSFSPDDTEGTAKVLMTVDEFETVRLLDSEGLTQELCAARMNVSRTTVTATYLSARKKIADMLVNGKQLLITGGCCAFTPVDLPSEITEKRQNIMRIAITYENGTVYGHFGHTAEFKFYDAENGVITAERVVPTNGSGHGALAGFLKAANVDVLICGGIGPGAQAALAEAGIRLYAGVSGDADAAAKALLAGTLAYDPDAHCDHRDHPHGSCGHDHCGDHSCR